MRSRRGRQGLTSLLELVADGCNTSRWHPKWFRVVVPVAFNLAAMLWTVPFSRASTTSCEHLTAIAGKAHKDQEGAGAGYRASDGGH